MPASGEGKQDTEICTWHCVSLATVWKLCVFYYVKFFFIKWISNFYPQPGLTSGSRSVFQQAPAFVTGAFNPVNTKLDPWSSPQNLTASRAPVTVDKPKGCTVLNPPFSLLHIQSVRGPFLFFATTAVHLHQQCPNPSNREPSLGFATVTNGSTELLLPPSHNLILLSLLKAFQQLWGSNMIRWTRKAQNSQQSPHDLAFSGPFFMTFSHFTLYIATKQVF